MKSWFALVFGPSTALGVQSVMYSMVTPSCASQSRLGIHLAAAVALLVVAVLAVLAFSDWSTYRAEPGASPDDDDGDPRSTRRFLAIVATAVAALSCLVIVGMWFGLWVLSPCDPWP
jgi:heme A synthase